MFQVSREFIKPQSGKPASVALGLFDGIHVGHQEVLSQALKNEEYTPCVFTYTISDVLPQNKQTYRRLMSDHYKCELLKRMGFELVVMPDFSDFKDMEPRVFVEKMLIEGMGARELSCGYDFTFGKKGEGDIALLREITQKHGVKLNVVSPIQKEGSPVSSTRIRAAVLDGHMDEAAELLGRHFSICMEVQHGNQIGRTLNFPTINQVFPNRHIVPRYGVYSTIVKIGDQLYGGVTNVGVKPTIGTDNPLAETYILNYSGDLYGQEVEVFFFDFLRSERKFSNVILLKEQIARDKEKILQTVEQNILQIKKEQHL